MKQCDRSLASASPFAIGSSSSLSFVASSESDPEDSFWRDFSFDFSFLSSEDQKTEPDDKLVDSLSVPSSRLKAEEESSALSVKDQSFDLKCVDSQLSPSLAVVITPVAKCIEKDDTEVNSPCWSGKRQSSGTRRSSDDVNGFYGLNPLAPHFVPSIAKKNLDKNGRDSEENSSSSALKKSLSLTFPPLLGEFDVTDLSIVEQGSDQTSRIAILIHEADESLGLVVSQASDECQKSKKLDPLAPVYVPACAKLSAVVHEKHGLDIERFVHSSPALSSADNTLLDYVKAETNSSEVDHRTRNRYANNVQLRSQVEISEKTKLDGSSNKSHGRKKLNPLAPRFSLADTKQKVYGCEENQAAINGYRNYEERHEAFSDDFGDRHGSSTPSSSSSKMDVKKLLTKIHGLSELLTHVHSSETSDSANEQYLDLMNCTVQNLNSYINRVQKHSGNYANAVHGSRDLSSFSNMRKVTGNHQTEEQINNPQVLFYRSLWLKADSSC